MAGRHTQEHPHGVHMENRTNSSAQEAQPPGQYADHCTNEGSAEAGANACEHDRQPWHPWEKDDYKGVNMNCCDEYGNCNQGRDCPVRRESEESDKSYVGSNLDLLLAAVALVFAASCIGYLWGGWR